MDAVIAVDFGATNLRAALVHRDGTLVHHHMTPTGARDGVLAIVERIVRLVDQVAREAGVERSVPVGVVAPGPLSQRAVWCCSRRTWWVGSTYRCGSC